jgi:hypothetical protein
MNEPLIYTSKGNLPIASLTYETEWLLLQREPLALKFVERHFLDGEVVKESAHVYDERSVFGAGFAANIG